MEVLVGPTFTIDLPPSPPSCGDAEEERAVPSCLYLNESAGCQDRDGSVCRVRGRPEFFMGEDLSETSSSSIGTSDDSDDNDVSSKRDREGEGEVEESQSKLKGGTGLCSLDSLEDSLPIKRGLSSHFAGKAKSFTDLSQVSTVKELQKQENPFNKRRRVLIASKWSRRSSLYSGSNPKSMPLLPVVDGDEDDDDHEGEKARKVSPSSSSSSSSLAEEKKDQGKLQPNRIPESYAPNMRLRLGSFKSRSFSLADLQEYDDEEEDDDD